MGVSLKNKTICTRRDWLLLSLSCFSLLSPPDLISIPSTTFSCLSFPVFNLENGRQSAVYGDLIKRGHWPTHGGGRRCDRERERERERMGGGERRIMGEERRREEKRREGKGREREREREDKRNKKGEKQKLSTVNFKLFKSKCHFMHLTESFGVVAFLSFPSLFYSTSSSSTTTSTATSSSSSFSLL